ncbi:MAG: mechanosensitive ion channel family protein [Tissierellales bacterium]|jgi:MscS family membrane protein|nr:mechanosensitive ion channel family protein [Tissierellales bacterium]
MFKIINNFFEGYIGEDYSGWLTVAIIILLFLILRRIFNGIIYPQVYKGLDKAKTTTGKRFWENFKVPIGRIIVFIGFYIALAYIKEAQAISEFKASESFILKLIKSMIIIEIASGFYRVIGQNSILFDKITGVAQIQASKILEPFVVKILRFIVIVIASSAIAELFGYSMDTIIAGLGIGGVAIALAAQDTLSNLLGGIIILLDKPFDIDDWINCNGIEGIVEDISFRSTRIRTFEKELIYVPNAIMSKEAIINYSKRGIRRARFKIGLTYSTSSSQMKNCIEKIEEYLNTVNEIDRDTILVKFEGFNDSSLDILIMYFAKTSEYQKYMEVREEINLAIMDIVEKESLSMAFPSTSVYFETPLDTK